MTRDFQGDNARYEKWLRTQCKVVEADLKYKHERMKKNSFVFLRATYFRWAKRIPKICPELNDAPAVLCVGDIHAENFGTWRDAEGRLVWGVNDFDDAASMPYPFDLARLATSIRLLPKRRISGRDATAAILAGYSSGLAAPRPILLDEQETWMRPYVACTDSERLRFWKEVDNYEDAAPPAQVAEDLLASAPKGVSLLRFASRTSGGGSLGRPRFIAISAWRGGRVVREAKASVPSAWNWARNAPTRSSRFLDLARGEYRSPDPHLAVSNGYILRKLAADSRKVDWSDAAGPGLTPRFLKAMGFDLGSIHAATEAAAKEIRDDLAKRPRGWLNAAAKTAASAVEEDYAEWVGVGPLTVGTSAG